MLIRSISCAVILAAAAAAQADVIDITVPGTTLSQVIGNQFVVGNHLFTLSPTAYSSAAFSPSQVFITPVTNADPMTGAGFRLTGAFNDVPGGSPSVFTLNYTVEETAAAMTLGLRFDRADLRFNGASSGSGSTSGISESLTSSIEGALGSLNVSANVGAAPVYQDQTVFASNSLTRLDAAMTGTFSAAGDGGGSSASFMDSSFGDRAVPAPSAIAALGALSLIAVRRRR